MKYESSAFPEPFLSLHTGSSADSGSALENCSAYDHLMELCFVSVGRLCTEAVRDLGGYTASS